MKILHTADIHLGDLTGPVKDGKNARRQDTIACMEYIAQWAANNKPDISIIAGDLFNRSRVWADTALDDVNDAIRTLIRPLCRCSDQVVVLFGTENHDNPRAFATLKETTANEKNLHIYTGPLVEALETKEGPVQIVAIPGFDRGRLRLFCPGADKETENRNATALVNDVVLGLAGQINHEMPSILVGHYTVAGSEADNGSTFLAGQDVVILPQTIDACKVNLACFGHIHKPQRLFCNTPAFYSGSVNQLNFNDEGTQHGFYLHTMVPKGERGKYGIMSGGHTFIPTPERQHYTLRIGAQQVADFIRTGDLPQVPEDINDAIVRVRYTCTAEQEKALNRAELQKKIQTAGAFYVAEILPEDVEDLSGGDELTEHDGPVEALDRWLAINEITGEDAQRLQSLALPIIKKADDGRNDSKHTGAFVPLCIEVKNYRSYTDANFNFSPINMAMVNGSNGVGKSSLFMDAICDCLYEQTRKEDTGGWVREGTKSGAVTFEFSMGGDTYRVIRTRTKTGRGTLALHRLDNEDLTWKDQSDTTMRLTQTAIEQLLGMDCNTFCSIALIRQDAYGLFLEADSDRRMEVLSALLGLDLYTRMEDIAKGEATDRRRSIATTRDRLAVLTEKISGKDTLLINDRELVQKADGYTDQQKSVEQALQAAQSQQTMIEELTRQADEKATEGENHGLQAMAKAQAAAETRSKLYEAQQLCEEAQQAEQAAEAVTTARGQLADLAPQEERLRSIRQEAGGLEAQKNEAQYTVQRLGGEREQLSAMLNRREEIQNAQKGVESLTEKRTAAEQRNTDWSKVNQRLQDAKGKKDGFLAESRIRIGSLNSKIEEAAGKAALLKDSKCPFPEQATCAFLSDARMADDALAGLRDELEQIKIADRTAYEGLDDEVKTIRVELEALGDPVSEINELAEKQRTLNPVAALAGRLASAEAQQQEIDRQVQQAQQKITSADIRLGEIKEALPSLESASGRADAARAAIDAHTPLADKLAACKAAAATVEALEPQAVELEREAREFEAKMETAMQQANAIRSRIPKDPVQLEPLLQQQRTLNNNITQIATERGGIRAKLESIEEAEATAAEYRAEIESTAKALNDYSTLVQAFGLDGIQYMIIRGIVPEITRRANDILAAMTAGRMAVDIRTEKEQRSTQKIVNSLEVWITSISGGSRPYHSHSGGEKVKISLAVTLALADVKARRAGVQLGMLFIDEPPFLDADGTEAYADALVSMAARNPGMRILAISHDPTMKARFQQNIIVNAGENGSTVAME